MCVARAMCALYACAQKISPMFTKPAVHGQPALSGPVDPSNCKWVVTQDYLVQGLLYFKCTFSD